MGRVGESGNAWNDRASFVTRVSGLGFRVWGLSAIGTRASFVTKAGKYERDREREREKEKKREGEREGERKRERERKREKERERERERERRFIDNQEVTAGW